MAKRRMTVAGMKKPSGLKVDGTPNASWQKFLDRQKQFSSLPVKDWSADQQLGYLVSRYREVYDIDFTFSFSGPPTKCRETFAIKRMIAYLGTNDAVVIKAYIDWIYDTQIIPKKMQLKSLAFFFTQKLIWEFKNKFKKNNKITRATPIPKNLENIAMKHEVDLVTYGDMAFAYMAAQNNSEEEEIAPYIDFFNEAQLNGLDVSIFSELDDS